MKLKVYPAMIVATIVALAGIGIGGVLISLWIGSSKPETSFSSLSTKEQVTDKFSPAPIPSPQATEIPKASLPESNPKSTLTSTETGESSKTAGTKAIASGAFRVSNRTEHPVRVVMLGRTPDRKSDAKPAHWDFAPEEGSRKGLLLSLPGGKFKLKPGDIIVVFAQDGSRRYWGPYITGETASPVWNAKAAEWQLVLEP